MPPSDRTVAVRRSTLTRSSADRAGRVTQQAASLASSAWKVTIVLVVAPLLLLGCATGSESEEAPPPHSEVLHTLLNDTTLVIAGRDTSRVEGFLTFTETARLIPDGSGVVITSRQPPYLRLFDENGRLQHTTLSRGSGPAETRRAPYGLAINGDQVVVLTSGGLHEFVLEGDSLRFAGHRWAPSGTLTLVSYCGDAWASYSVPRTTEPSDEVILKTLTVDSAGGIRAEPRATSSTFNPRLEWGGRQQIYSDDLSVYLRHHHSLTAPLLRIPCNEDEPVEVLRHTRDAPPTDDFVQLTAEVVSFVMRFPRRDYTGFAVHEGKLIESETYFEMTDGRSRRSTIIRVSDGEARQSLAVVDQDWRLLDYHGGHLLFHARHGEPYFSVLHADALITAFASEFREGS